jgi:hypothetical protein
VCSSDLNNVTTDKIPNSAIITDKIANNAITSTKIANNAVGTTEIADSSIIESKIANSAVTSTKIANNAVGTTEIATGAVGTTEIADNSITTAKILNNNITTAKIADDAITTAKIENNAVTTAQIANDSITPAKISADGPSWGGGTFSTNTQSGLELGPNIAANTNSFIDFHSAPGGDYDARVWRRPGVNGNLDIYNSGTGAIWLNQIGSGSINFATNNTYRGSFDNGGTFNVQNNINVTGDIYATSYTARSSIVFKKDIQPLEGCLQNIQKLQGVSYKWKDTEIDDIGLIAEDVNKIYPTIVKKDEQDVPLGVDYGKLVAVLIEGIKQLTQRVEELENKITELTNE